MTLSIQAVRGLPRLRAPGTVACIALYTAVNAQSEKPAEFVGRTSTGASIVNFRRRPSQDFCQPSTDDDGFFIALSVHLCRTRLTTRCDVVKFYSPEFRTKLHGEVPLLLRKSYFLET